MITHNWSIPTLVYMINWPKTKWKTIICWTCQVPLGQAMARGKSSTLTQAPVDFSDKFRAVVGKTKSLTLTKLRSTDFLRSPLTWWRCYSSNQPCQSPPNINSDEAVTKRQRRRLLCVWKNLSVEICCPVGQQPPPRRTPESWQLALGGLGWMVGKSVWETMFYHPKNKGF